MDENRRSANAKETLLGICLLMLLAGIGAGVYFEQYRFYPALIEPVPFSAVPAGSSTQKTSIFRRIRLPGGLAPLSPVETFDAATLSDKIDGKAPLYLSAGFEHLETRRFFLKETPDAWMEAFVYRMNGPQSAFSVFSMQKREGALPLELGQSAYRTPNALYFIAGSYYVELVASSETPFMETALRALGKSLLAGLPVSEAAVAGDRLFPENGLDVESVRRIPADAFGFEKLDNVYTALYRVDGIGLTAFVSRRTDAAAARDLTGAYRAFLLEFDAEILETGLPATEHIVACSVMGWTEVLFSQGPYFAGVHQATDEKKALELAIYLNEYLKKLDATN